ncbi:MAG: electron transport complex subunit RsxC [Blautia sp.]|nr:electron transport complex subunit RsxC [Blautia sp.]
MGIYSFRGGVHPAGNKELTRDMALTPFLARQEMVYPLGQHIGKPAAPVVKKGDEVLAGQLIAQADGFVSANIYSACSGKVKAVDHHLSGAGIQTPCIIIDNDGQYTPAPGVGTACDYADLTGPQILDKIKWAGIVGLGGAGFPTHVKLAPKNPSAIQYFIANGAECEPGITCDDRLMVERPEEIIEGMKLILRLFPKANGVIAIEANKPEAIKIMKKAVSGDDRLSVLVLKVKYPQGSERNLVHAVTHKYMPSGSLPADLGCVVDNVTTISAIYRAVAFNEPLMEKGLTVTGDGVERPGNFKVRLGTSVQELLEHCGLKDGVKKIYLGGPMMGLALSDTGVPLVKTNNAITCMMTDPVEESERFGTNCIRCGRCTRVCPMGLLPQQMSEAAEKKNYERYVKFHGTDCIACGCCTYTCPAKRPLTQLFAQTKPAAMAWKREHEANKEGKA